MTFDFTNCEDAPEGYDHTTYEVFACEGYDHNQVTLFDFAATVWNALVEQHGGLFVLRWPELQFDREPIRLNNLFKDRSKLKITFRVSPKNNGPFKQDDYIKLFAAIKYLEAA